LLLARTQKSKSEMTAMSGARLHPGVETPPRHFTESEGHVRHPATSRSEAAYTAAVYDFWVFVHLGGLLLFVAGHGTSATAGMRLRRERDPERMTALLDASASARGSTYAGMALLGVGGFAAAFAGHWWSSGWLWTSVVLFVAMAGVLVALAIPYYRRVRAAVAVAAETSDRSEIDRLAASPVPLVILGVGLGGLAVILWLMVFKPF